MTTVAKVGPGFLPSFGAPLRKEWGGILPPSGTRGGVVVVFNYRLKRLAVTPGNRRPPARNRSLMWGHTPCNGQRAFAPRSAPRHKQGRIKMRPSRIFLRTENLITKTAVPLKIRFAMSAFSAWGGIRQAGRPRMIGSVGESPMVPLTKTGKKYNTPVRLANPVWRI